MRPRDRIVIVAIAVVWAALVQLPQLGVLAGLSIDELFRLRAFAFGPRYAPAASPTVVVAIDEETYRRPPFDDIPIALWTPQLGRTLRAIEDAGAAVVGFDLILPTSAQRLVPGFDRPFLLALRDASRDGRVVLGKVQNQQLPIRPFAGQSFAVGNERNIRSTNLFVEHDDVVRRVPLLFQSDDLVTGSRWEPSLSLELAARAAGVAVAPAPNGVRFGDWLIPGSVSNTLLINFDSGANVPTYNFADLSACAGAGKRAYFAEHFAHKVVLFGSVLDLEDRKLTSKRLIAGGEPVATGDRCVLAPMTGLIRADSLRDEIPGVYVHAAAVNDLLRRDVLREIPPPLQFAAAGGLALITAALLAIFPILTGTLAALVPLVLWIVAATLAFAAGWVLPLLPGALAAAGTGISVIGYRVAVTDRDKRRLHRIFGLYLAPAVVDELAAGDTMPALGGERREMTFVFTDVADFTTLSERLDPATLGHTINAYLERVCDVIMAHGGLVNEFLGDGVLAFFGAPLAQPDHAAQAVACALELQTVTEAFRREQVAAGIPFGRTRIGLHTGPAVVGNFGSEKRLKYTALGDTVNTASRIEGLNKYFGTTLAASETTVQALDPGRFRPLGAFRLKGKSETLAVFELLDPDAAVSPYVARYRLAYAALQSGSDDARSRFEALAAEDPNDGCVAFHLARLRSGERSATIVMEGK
jgi:class 3 adenylate cyclase